MVVGEEAHASVFKALGLLGLGRKRVVRVPVDGQGRMRADALPHLDAQTILCLQAGNVNTGAFDPAAAICPAARAAGAWIHVDGAFGLWAAASPEYRTLDQGLRAGRLLGYRRAQVAQYRLRLRHCPGARSRGAAGGDVRFRPRIWILGEHREPSDYNPELSRRARGVELWAGLRSLGRSGMAEIVERTSSHARRFAAGLKAAGFQVLNEVVINQVLVSFGVAGEDAAGDCPAAGRGNLLVRLDRLAGQTAMRISVSSWATTKEDVDRSLAAMVKAAET